MVESKLVFQSSGTAGKGGTLRLTLVGDGDAETLKREGVSALRRKRLIRLASEAFEQGCPIGYRELSDLLFTSVSTLKRDVAYIEQRGGIVPIRGRRKLEAGS
jgi:hypothetical protein